MAKDTTPRIDKGLYWDRAWSLVSGCTPVSPGCDHCWSASEASMRQYQANPKIQARYGGLVNENGQFCGKVRCNDDLLSLPLRIRKPTRWAIWTDLFHEDVPDEFIDRAFAVMNATTFRLPIARNRDGQNWHTYLLLTKRPQRMAAYIASRSKNCNPIFIAGRGTDGILRGSGAEVMNAGAVLSWPLRNTWIGTTVEDQKRADERHDAMRSLALHDWNTWVSYEPALGSVVWSPWMQFIRWAVAGGESGPWARPSHPEWFRSLQRKCESAGVPFFFKQWGEWEPFPLTRPGERYAFSADGRKAVDVDGLRFRRVGKKAAGCLLDGREWKELPKQVTNQTGD